MTELPDLDDVLREGARTERKRSLALGAIVTAGGLALWLGSRSLFGDQIRLLPPGVIAFGVMLLANGLRR